MRETALLSKEKYPEVNEMVEKDVCVDDCMSGESSIENCYQKADLEIVLNKGVFTLKGFTFSRKLPLETLSDDNETISVAGMKWYPEGDKLSLNIGEINFVEKN